MLIGGSAILERADTGDASNTNGAFSFEAAVGPYTVVFSYIGYNRVSANDPQAFEGKVTLLEITLLPEAIEVGEVVVDVALLLDNETGLLRERSRANAISEAISAQTIRRSGSGDAAAALTKVTGASVVDGRYGYLRGLGVRYANTMLNGGTLPSADPDRKAFQLDLFPATLGSSLAKYSGPYFTPTNYTGAFGTNNWAYGWTALDHLGYLGEALSTSTEASTDDLPCSISLAQIYPSPFNTATAIEFAIERAQRVLLAVDDMVGRQVALLEDGQGEADIHGVDFDASTLPSGLYVYCLRTTRSVIARKMMLLD